MLINARKLVLMVKVQLLTVIFRNGGNINTDNESTLEPEPHRHHVFYILFLFNVGVETYTEVSI